jgi:transposase InsO family protein
MNSVGSYYDNAPMESFFGALKTEWVHHVAYQTRDQARTDLFFFIEVFTVDNGSTRLWDVSARRLGKKRMLNIGNAS